MGVPPVIIHILIYEWVKYKPSIVGYPMTLESPPWHGANFLAISRVTLKKNSLRREAPLFVTWLKPRQSCGVRAPRNSTGFRVAALYFITARYGGFHKWIYIYIYIYIYGVPQKLAGIQLMENPIKMNDLGHTRILGNLHIIELVWEDIVLAWFESWNTCMKDPGCTLQLKAKKWTLPFLLPGIDFSFEPVWPVHFRLLSRANRGGEPCQP